MEVVAAVVEEAAAEVMVEAADSRGHRNSHQAALVPMAAGSTKTLASEATPVQERADRE